MTKITSRENQKIKEARKIALGRQKNLIFVEGLRLTEEVLRSIIEVKEVFFTENFLQTSRGTDLLEEIFNRQIPSFEVNENVFNSLSDTKNPQGIILIGRRPTGGKAAFEADCIKELTDFPIIPFLYQINNPANLGAILRSAEAVNVPGVIVSKNSADVFSTKALRAAMGANLRVPIWESADFFEVLDWAKMNNLIPTAADINADKNYLEINWKLPRLLIFGSEAHGLSEKEQEQITESVFIPMKNGVESLNLAVSCGIFLFEAQRQYEF